MPITRCYSGSSYTPRASVTGSLYSVNSQSEPAHLNAGSQPPRSHVAKPKSRGRSVGVSKRKKRKHSSPASSRSPSPMHTDSGSDYSPTPPVKPPRAKARVPRAQREQFLNTDPLYPANTALYPRTDHTLPLAANQYLQARQPAHQRLPPQNYAQQQYGNYYVPPISLKQPFYTSRGKAPQ